MLDVPEMGSDKLMKLQLATWLSKLSVKSDIIAPEFHTCAQVLKSGTWDYFLCKINVS